MNIDLEILRATLGDLVLQSVSLQSALKAAAEQKASHETPPKEEKTEAP